MTDSSLQAFIFALIKQLDGNNIIPIPRLFVDLTGNMETAIFLSQLLFWSDKGKRSDGFIYKSRQEWVAETGLTDYSLRMARERLEKMGILETKLHRANGAPTLHYRLEQEALVNHVRRFVEINKSDLSESANGNVEIDKSMICRNQQNPNIDHQETTTRNVGVVLSESQERACACLLAFGWDKKRTARRYASKHDPDQITGLVEYAREQGLTVGWVRDQLNDDEWAPVIEDSPAGRVEAAAPAELPPPRAEVTAAELGVPVEAIHEWEKVLELLQGQMTKETFTSLLAGSVPLQCDDGRAVIRVRSQLEVDWLTGRLRPVVEKAAARVVGRTMTVTFVAGGSDD